MEALLRKKDSEAQRGSSVMSSFLSLLFTSLLALFFYAHCSTKITPCDGDPTADPEFECLPLPPDISEPEYDGGDYKIPFSGIDGLNKYELQELCFDKYVNEDDLGNDWKEGPWKSRLSEEDISANASHIDADSTQPLCYYKLRSCNQYGCGRWSNVIKIVKGLLPPGDFRVENSPYSSLSSRDAYVLEGFTVGFSWNALSPPPVGAATGVVVSHYEFGKEDETGSVPGGQTPQEDDEWEDMGSSEGHSLAEASRLYGKSYGYQIRTCGYVIETSGESPEVTCGAGSSLDVEIRLPLPSSPYVNGGDADSYTRVYDVTWGEVSVALGYELQYRKDGGNWKPLSEKDTSSGGIEINTSAREYISRGGSGGTYEYRVRACTVENPPADRGDDREEYAYDDDIRCSYGWREGSDSVTVHVLQVGPLSGPSGGVSRETSYNISWSEVAGAQVYILKETSEGVERTVDTVDGSTLSVDVSGREYGKSYSYLLTACAGSGSDGSDGSEKDESCETRDESGALEIEVKPARLAGLVIDESNSTDGEYSLDWTIASADPGSYYKIEERSRALGGSFGDWSALSSENANSYSIDKPGSAFERDYEYRVSLCAANHVCGEPSASVALSLRFEKPSLTVDGTIKASGEYSLGWSGVTKAASYVTQVIDKAANAVRPRQALRQAGRGAPERALQSAAPRFLSRRLAGRSPGRAIVILPRPAMGACAGPGLRSTRRRFQTLNGPNLATRFLLVLIRQMKKTMSIG